MTTDNSITDLNADGIMAKMLAEQKPEAKKNQRGNNEDDLSQLGFGLVSLAEQLEEQIIFVVSDAAIVSKRFLIATTRSLPFIFMRILSYSK